MDRYRESHDLAHFASDVGVGVYVHQVALRPVQLARPDHRQATRTPKHMPTMNPNVKSVLLIDAPPVLLRLPFRSSPLPRLI